MKIVARTVALGLALLSLLLGGVSVSRMRMPYNEEGRYFDGVVVYHRQAIPLYAGLAVLAGLTSAALALASRRA